MALVMRLRQTRVSANASPVITTGSGAKAVVVPFSGGKESEQALRAELLARRGLIEMVSEDALTPEILAGALDRNLKLWVGIRTLVQQADNPLPMPIKDNLIRLSSFVAQKTFEMQNGANAKTIEALANTNLQISEGLLDKRSH